MSKKDLKSFLDSLFRNMEDPREVFSLDTGKNFSDFLDFDIFLESWVNSCIDDKDEALRVLKQVRVSKLLNDLMRERAMELLKNIKPPVDLFDFASDVKKYFNLLGDDAKRALENFETASRFLIKYAIAWSNYALDRSSWKEIGYLGPRGVPFAPPKKIARNKIVMTICDKVPNEANMYNRFRNAEYEEQMKKKNRLLKRSVKEIGKYPKGYEPDVVVIGTGAGGGAVAHTLSQKLVGKKIAVLERGGLYTSEEFNQLEKEMLPALYQAPGVRFTDDFGVAIIQGSLVGGSATLNHAVCYEAPLEVTSTWERDISSELKQGGYYERVREMIHYEEIWQYALNKNAQVFQKGLKRLKGQAEMSKYFEYNVRNTNAKIAPDGKAGERYHELTCTGCGFCVLGCSYDRKQTPLITYIPAAIKNGQDGVNGNEVRFFKNAAVAEILHDSKKITGVKVETGVGQPDLIIKTKAVVVASGAINSAKLLLKSGVRNKHLGKEMSLHPSPLIYGVFEASEESDYIYADWGVPMAAAYAEYQFPRPEDGFPDKFGYILETIYNHPASTAVTFPVRKIKERMRDYEKTANISVILHDRPMGEVTGDNGFLTCMSYKLHEDDKFKLRHAIRTAAHILLKAGAKEVFTNHEKELVFRTTKDLKKADNCPIEPGRILLATAHPQGGCKMGKKGAGVVDFKGHSHDVANLFVCDASLFPTSLGVNPQLTIMALATKIGDDIADRLNS